MAEEEAERTAVADEPIRARGDGDNHCPLHQKNNESSKVSDSSSDSSSQKNKGKSCKGALFYSSALKSKSRNPFCAGLTRSLPHVPRYIVGESEMEASKEGRSLTDFQYGCIGYSVYSDQKGGSANGQEIQTELPVCVGLEVLVDRRVVTADSASAHIHNKEDGTGVPPPRSRKPAHSVGDEFLSRFTRNAGLVANGVAKNMCKVGNRIKETVEDILFPYRRRPK